MNFIYKFNFVLNCICTIVFAICLVYNVFKGMVSHDVYYLVMAIIDYGFMRLNFKNIENYIDIDSKMC